MALTRNYAKKLSLSDINSQLKLSAQNVDNDDLTETILSDNTGHTKSPNFSMLEVSDNASQNQKKSIVDDLKSTNLITESSEHVDFNKLLRLSA